jgi:uncharacterized protein YcbX
MATVRAIHVSAVKSLRLTAVPEAHIGLDGIAGDRRFVLLDDRGRVATQRTVGALAAIRSAYDAATGELALILPDGREVRAAVDGGTAASVELWGRPVPGRVLAGPWTEAVSQVAGTSLRLMETAGGIRALDSHPVSLLAEASAEEVGLHGSVAGLDPRRFRPTLLVDGLGAHEEDGWVGRRVAAGDAVLRIVRLDPRCSLTTRNPDTGERDADTLRWLASYRRAEDGEVCCGVYADVESPGRVRIGDPVVPEDRAA